MNGIVVKKDDDKVAENYDAFRIMLEREQAAKMFAHAG